MNSVIAGTHLTRVCALCLVQWPARDTRNKKLLPNEWTSPMITRMCPYYQPTTQGKEDLNWQQPPRSYGLKLQIISIRIVTFNLLITLSILSEKQDWVFLFIISIGTRKVQFFWNLFFFSFRLSTSLLGTHRNHRRSKESILYLRRHLFQTYNSLKIKQNRKYEGKILCQKPFKDKVFHHSKLRKILS